MLIRLKDSLIPMWTNSSLEDLKFVARIFLRNSKIDGFYLTMVNEQNRTLSPSMLLPVLNRITQGGKIPIHEYSYVKTHDSKWVC